MRTLSFIMVLAVVTSVASLLRASPSDAPPPARLFDARSFAALPPADQLDFLVASLQSREAALENFSYVLKQSISKIKGGQPEAPFDEQDVELWRKGPVSLAHRVWFPRQMKEDERWNRWDGSITRSRRLRKDGASLGSISKAQNNSLRLMAYNEILGYLVTTPRVGKDAVEMTRSQWLVHLVRKHGREFEISVDDSSQSPLVKVRIYPDKANRSDVYDFWLDPQRDFMLSREEYKAQYGADSGYRRSVVTASMQADGLWVPTEIVQVRCASTMMSEGTQYKTVVSKFERGRVADGDLVLDFPPGTSVLDATGEVETRAVILADGGSKPLRHFDSKTRLLNDGTSATAKVPSKIFAHAQQPFPKNHRSWSVAMVAGAFAVLGTGILVALRHRRVGL